SLAAAALRAGKHVVVDKPMAPTLEEARATAALARKSGPVLAVFQNRRWDGDFLALTDLLSRGVLGDVSHFESHFDRYRPTGRDRSWIKYGVDAQERQMVTALTPGDGVAPGETEHAVLFDGASAARTDMPLPPGDYPEFYRRVRDAIAGAGRNPVPPEQAVAVAAVIDTVIRSSAEGRALTLPLTEAERLEFSR